MASFNHRQGLTYLRVADQLRQRILEGSYGPGDRLPKQHDLAKQMGVSLSTLTNALNVLEREFYIVRKAGRGTYVSLPQEHSPTALVVDDEENIRNLLSVYLDTQGWQCVGVASGADALEAARSQNFDLVLLDLVMPKMNGAETFRRLRELDFFTNVVIITAYPDSDLVWEALQTGPFAILSKPVVFDSLKTILDGASAISTFRENNPRLSARTRLPPR